MGATIRTAIEMRAYTLTNRATWIAYGHKLDFEIVFEGEKALFNQYGIIAVNSELFPHVNAAGAQVFIDWMFSAHGQELIAGYLVDGHSYFSQMLVFGSVNSHLRDVCILWFDGTELFFHTGLG